MAVAQSGTEIEAGASGGASLSLATGGTSLIAGGAVALHGAGVGLAATSDAAWAMAKLIKLNLVVETSNNGPTTPNNKKSKSTTSKGADKLAIRSDIELSGDRDGQKVKNLTSAANSVLKGNKGRIYITNDKGQVIWDITKYKAKPVIPGRGFGSFEYGKVSQEHLDLLNKVWGK